MSMADTDMTETVQECNNWYDVGFISNSFAEGLLLIYIGLIEETVYA